MNIRVLLFALAVLTSVSAIVFLNSENRQPDKQFVANQCVPGIQTYLLGEKMRDPHAVPNDWMALQRTYPYDRIKTESYVEAMKQARDLHSQSSVKYEWEAAGPENIGGRITDIEVVAENTDIIYLGGATGGILKSVDGGVMWENIFDDQPVITIGDIALDPSNSDVIYAGTGEANSSSYSFLGNGVYKSTDAGQTWQQSGLEQSVYIGRIVVDHSNSQRVFVAACGNLFSEGGERGVYRSNNGGETWERILYLNDSTSAIDLVQHPENPDILYATMWERIRRLEYRRSFGNSSGIWKTTNGGDTWAELTYGLPTGIDVGRIGIDIAKSNPDILYAFYDRQSSVNVYRTANGGATWLQTNDFDLQGMNSNFGWYFGQIKINPADENQFYIMGVTLWRSDNGGSDYTELAGYWNNDVIHVDHHAMWIDENTGRIYEGNDGGFYISDNEGYGWTKFTNLPLTQFYAIDIDYDNPERIYGGTQDNNTIRTLTGDLYDWEPILGGDGMYTLVDYSNSNFIFAEYQYGMLFRSSDLGYTMFFIGQPAQSDRTNWSSPYVLHPENPDIMYFGTYRIWKGTNHGLLWEIISPDLTMGGESGSFHTISTIAISAVDPEIIITGSDDGKVYKTTNGGSNWVDISEGLPVRWITSVACDPFDENTIYATISGFRWEEDLPHVFRSENLGENWTDISGNLPQLPVNQILPDPEFEERYFVATDAGLFSTDNGGISWFGISAGMPNVPTMMMKIHNPTRTLVAGTYGNSCYRIELNKLVSGLGQENENRGNFSVNVYPNPASAFTNITCNLPSTGLTDISVTDIQGKLVKKLLGEKMSQGCHSLTWDLTSQQGMLCSTGLYFVVIKQGKKVDIAKIMVSKNSH